MINRRFVGYILLATWIVDMVSRRSLDSETFWNPQSRGSRIIHRAYYAASDPARCCASHVDLYTVDCLRLHHAIGDSHTVLMMPALELRSLSFLKSALLFVV